MTRLYQDSLSKKKKKRERETERTKLNKTRYKTEAIIIHSTEIQRIIKEYCEKLCQQIGQSKRNGYISENIFQKLFRKKQGI